MDLHPIPQVWSPDRRLRVAWTALALSTIPLTQEAHAVRRLDRHAAVELHSRRSPVLRAPCPAGLCRSESIDALGGGRCPDGPRADAVVVSGHGRAAHPAEYLGVSPAALAHAVGCFEPDLVVLDVCEGLGDEILRSLSAAGVDALVVGSAQALPPAGLSFGAAFFDRHRSTAERAAAVGAPAGVRLRRWRLSPAALDRAERDVARMGPAALSERLETVLPNLVSASLDPDAEVLIEVPSSRLREAAR
jgi:hypothetical protein